MTKLLLGNVAAPLLRIGGGGGVGAASWTVTVPSGEVGSDLTDFPLRIHLEDMPASFWSAVDDAGDTIRVYAADGTTLIPHDCAFIRPSQRAGDLFCKVTLAAAADTVVVVKTDGTGGRLADADANGRNAVWSDYEVVISFPDREDRAGKRTITASGDALVDHEWTRKGFNTTLAGNPHQGVSTNGTDFIWVDTTEMYRGDMSYALQVSDTDVPATLAAEGLTGIDHLGDPVIVGTSFYLTATAPGSPPGGAGYFRYLVKFNLATLAYEDSWLIDGADHVFGATVCYDGTHLILFSFTDGSKFLKYTLAGVKHSEVALSQTIDDIQGSVVISDGTIYASEDNTSRIYAIEPDGTVGDIVYIDPHGDLLEGIAYHNDGTDEYLWVNKSDGDLVELDRTHQGWGWIHFEDDFRVEGIPETQTWTAAASVYTTQFDEQIAYMGVYRPGTGGGHTGLLYDNGPDQIDVFNGDDSWMDPPTSYKPPAYSDMHLAYSHDVSATERSLWLDGVLLDRETGVTAYPKGSVDPIAFSINASYANAPDDGSNYFQFMWFRAERMSDDWMAADAANRVAGGSFYAIT